MAAYREEEDPFEEDIVFDQAGLLNHTSKINTAIRRVSSGKCVLFAKTLGLCGAFFGLGLCIAIPGPTFLSPLTALEVNVSSIYVARSSGYLIGAIIGGMLFDHFNRLFLLFLSLLLTSVLITVAPWCQILWLQVACMVTLGIAMGFLDIGGNVLCLDLWGRNSGPFMQALHFSFGLGAFVAPLLAVPFLEPTSFSTFSTDVSQVVSDYPVQVINVAGADVSPLDVVERLKRDIEGFNDSTVFKNSEIIHDSEIASNNNILAPKLNASMVVTKSNPFLNSDATVPVLLASESHVSPTSDTKPAVASTTMKQKTQKHKPAKTDGAKLGDVNWDAVHVRKPSAEDLIQEPDVTTKTPKPSTTVSQLSELVSSTGTPLVMERLNGTNVQPASSVLFSSDVTTVSSSAPFNPLTSDVSPDSLPVENIISSTLSSEMSSDNGLHIAEGGVTLSNNISSTQEYVTTLPVYADTHQSGAEIHETLPLHEESAKKLTLNNTENFVGHYQLEMPQLSLESGHKEDNTDHKNTSHFVSDTNNASEDSHVTKVSNIGLQEYNNQNSGRKKPLNLDNEKTFLDSKAPANQKLTEGGGERKTSKYISPEGDFPSVTGYSLTSRENESQLRVDSGQVVQENTTKYGGIETYPANESPLPVSAVSVATTTMSDQGEIRSPLNYMNSVAVLKHVHRKPGTFDNDTEHINTIFDVFANRIEKYGFSKLQFSYLIVGIFVFSISVVFLGFLCHNPRDPKSKQEEGQGSKKIVNKTVHKLLVTLMAFFFFLYMGMEVTYGQLVLAFAMHSNLKLSPSTGSVISIVFWGSFAAMRFASIFFASGFSPITMLILNFVFCTTGTVLVSALANHVETALWVGTALIGIGLASMFPTGILWIERYIHVSNKVAAVFVIGVSLGQMICPITVYQLMVNSPQMLMHSVLVINIICILAFVALWWLASRQGEKYSVVINNGYQLANQNDEEEDMLDMSPSGSSISFRRHSFSSEHRSLLNGNVHRGP